MLMKKSRKLEPDKKIPKIATNFPGVRQKLETRFSELFRFRYFGGFALSRQRAPNTLRFSPPSLFEMSSRPSDDRPISVETRIAEFRKKSGFGWSESGQPWNKFSSWSKFLISLSTFRFERRPGKRLFYLLAIFEAYWFCSQQVMVIYRSQFNQPGETYNFFLFSSHAIACTRTQMLKNLAVFSNLALVLMVMGHEMTPIDSMTSVYGPINELKTQDMN